MQKGFVGAEPLHSNTLSSPLHLVEQEVVPEAAVVADAETMVEE